jgi:spore coat polysaccharide biosynthesis predicted glycosyltransferase SpsG
MRAVFITEANQEIGLGHLKRCYALAMAFVVDKIVEVEIIIPEINDANSRILREEKITYYSFINRIKFLRNQNPQELFFIVDIKTNFYDQFIQEFASKRIKMFGIDDFTQRNSSYTANFAPPNSLMPESFNDFQRNRNFIGWNWVPIQGKLWLAQNMQKNLINNILLLFGGSDGDRLSLPSCKYFTQILKENYFTLIGGPLMSKSDFKICQLIASKSENLGVVKSPANLYQLMGKNRFSITSFGHTFYELIALKNYPLGIYRSNFEVEGLLSKDNSLEDYLISVDEYKNIVNADSFLKSKEFWDARFESLQKQNSYIEGLSLQLESGCSNIKNIIYSAI